MLPNRNSRAGATPLERRQAAKGMMENPALRCASVRGPGVHGGLAADGGMAAAGADEMDFSRADGSRVHQQHVVGDPSGQQQQYQQQRAVAHVSPISETLGTVAYQAQWVCCAPRCERVMIQRVALVAGAATNSGTTKDPC